MSRILTARSSRTLMEARRDGSPYRKAEQCPARPLPHALRAFTCHACHLPTPRLRCLSPIPTAGSIRPARRGPGPPCPGFLPFIDRLGSESFVTISVALHFGAPPPAAQRWIRQQVLPATAGDWNGVPRLVCARHRSLREEADCIVCLERPTWFEAVGQFYDDFRQITDAEVAALLARFLGDQASNAIG